MPPALGFQYPHVWIQIWCYLPRSYVGWTSAHGRIGGAGSCAPGRSSANSWFLKGTSRTLLPSVTTPTTTSRKRGDDGLPSAEPICHTFGLSRRNSSQSLIPKQKGDSL